MARLAFRGGAEQRRHVVLAFHVGLVREVQVAAVGLRLAREGGLQVLFRLGAFECCHGNLLRGGWTLPEYPFVAPPELATGEVKRHPIVIVGGGITGLTLACALAQYGIKAVLLDEDNTVGVKGASSRGICYTQKSLEIFERLGIYERIAAKGIQWSVGRTFAGADEVYSFDLRQHSYNLSSGSRPSSTSSSSTSRLPGRAALRARAGPRRPALENRVTAFEQNGEGATLTVETPAGELRPAGRACDRLPPARTARFRLVRRVGHRARRATTAGALPMCASRIRRRSSATPGSKRRSTRTAPSGST
jgi:hypothetical protein